MKEFCPICGAELQTIKYYGTGGQLDESHTSCTGCLQNISHYVRGRYETHMTYIPAQAPGCCGPVPGDPLVQRLRDEAYARRGECLRLFGPGYMLPGYIQLLFDAAARINGLLEERDQLQARIARLEVVATTMANEIEDAYTRAVPPCDLCADKETDCRHREFVNAELRCCPYFSYYQRTTNTEGGDTN